VCACTSGGRAPEVAVRRLPLQREPASGVDARPMLLAVVALMLLLLPLLLLTTSPQRLTSIELSLAGEGGEATSVVEQVEITAVGGEITVRASVRRTDLGAERGEVERRELHLGPAPDGQLDLAGLQRILLGLRAVDDSPARVQLWPDDALSTQQVVDLLDAIRIHRGEPLFQEVVLEGPPDHGRSP